MSDRPPAPPPGEGDEPVPPGIEEPAAYEDAAAAAWAALVALLGAAAAAVIVEGLVDLSLWPFDAWDPSDILAVSGAVYAREFTRLRPTEDGTGAQDVPQSADDAERHALNWIAVRENVLQRVDDEVFRQVQSKVAASLRSGSSEAELTAEVRDILNPNTTQVDWYSRAQRIARTEVHAAEQAGQDALIDGLVRSGAIAAPRFRWLNAGDDRVRPRPALVGPFNHHGVEPVTWPEPFIVSGEALRYPGDPVGSAGNVINCRCTKIRTR